MIFIEKAMFQSNLSLGCVLSGNKMTLLFLIYFLFVLSLVLYLFSFQNLFSVIIFCHVVPFSLPALLPDHPFSSFFFLRHIGLARLTQPKPKLDALALVGML